MRIKTFTLNTKEEVLNKVTREILTLFGVKIVGNEDADYLQLSVIHRRRGERALSSVLILFDRCGRATRYERAGDGAPDEKPGAAINRLAKRNLYEIFIEELGFAPAPWGILHGVRPTKIVHRFIRMGMDEAAVSERLAREYAVGAQKRDEIVPMAFRQLPFLRTSDERTVSIYVGIPFCLTRCLYCSFPANVLPGEEKLREFMAVFRRDLEAARADVERLSLTVQNIYIGGGTPTSLPDVFFAEMLEMVYNAFYGEKTHEFTVEAGRPDSITPAKIAAMRDHHVTRVSVNPQSMQQKTLDIIGRHHTPGDIVRMFHALRQEPFSINMDVILALPGETVEDVEDTMERIAALGPDDITLHALALKRGSRLMRLMEEREVPLPSGETARQMFAAAMRVVRRLGMQPYYLYRQGYMAGDLENVGCARPGAESMYNIQIMEERQTIVGVGGAATSKVVFFRENRIRSSFHPKDLTTYLRDIDIYIEKRRTLLDAAYQ